MLIPTRRRTWGPQGQTPIVRYSYRHDRISAIAAITVASKRARMGLYVQFRQDNFKAPQVAKFLRLLLRHLRGNVIVVWDGGRIHKGPHIRAVQDAFPETSSRTIPCLCAGIQSGRRGLERFQTAHGQYHSTRQTGHSSQPAQQYTSSSAISG